MPLERRIPGVTTPAAGIPDGPLASIMREWSRNVFFLVGCGRSGTSLLRAMISEHPQAYAVNETQFCHVIYRKHRRALAGLTGAAFVDAAVDRAFRYWWIRELGVDRHDVAAHAVAGGCTWASVFLSLLVVHTRGRRVTRIGDKSPANIQHSERLDEWFPQGRTIHIMRDPRAVLASFRNVDVGPKAVAPIAARWRDAALKHLSQPVDRPDRHLLIRYEEMAASPESQMSRVCSFLNLEDCSGMAQFYQRKEHGFSRHKLGHMQNTLKPVFTDSIEKWRDQLSKTDVALVEHVCGDLMDRLDYQRTAARLSFPRARLAASYAAGIVDRVRSKRKLAAVARDARRPVDAPVVPVERKAA